MSKRRLGFLTPSYPGEKRVAMLPDDLPRMSSEWFDAILVEDGFGASMDRDNSAYITAGCAIASRAEILSCDLIVSLKLIQPPDYPSIQEGAVVIGWIHPMGGGRAFWSGIACQKGLTLVDLDSVRPRLCFPDQTHVSLSGLFPPHMFWENSYIAGQMSVVDALHRYYGDELPPALKACVLGSGSVSQGAFGQLAVLGFTPRMFTRKTLQIFRQEIELYDIIVNGVEMDRDGVHLIDQALMARSKPEALVIEAAADAGRAIQGSSFRPIHDPLGVLHGRSFYMVSNAPTLGHREASAAISRVLATHVLQSQVMEALWSLIAAHVPLHDEQL